MTTTNVSNSNASDSFSTFSNHEIDILLADAIMRDAMSRVKTLGDYIADLRAEAKNRGIL